MQIKSDVTVIMTLYKTPSSKLKNLENYKNFKLILFEQETDGKNLSELKKNLKLNFKYFYSNKNIGLSKASNLLFSKVKTKYFLFTQPDIKISLNEIKKLYKTIKQNKELIFVTPVHSRTKKITNVTKPNFKIVKKIKAAIMMCDTKKVKKTGFFDEDYFLYWEDISLMKKINNSEFKMALVKNSFATHNDSESSIKSLKVNQIRQINFIYGEFLFDYKNNQFRLIKLTRKILQNLALFFFNIIFYKQDKILENYANLLGMFKFIKFYLYKILISK